MAKCYVCKHRSERDTCKFLKFRKSPGMRRRWKRGLRLDKSPGQSLLCICHFPNNDISRTPVAPKTALTPSRTKTTPAEPRGKARRGLFLSTPLSRDHGYANLSGIMEISAETSDDNIGLEDLSPTDAETTMDCNNQQDCSNVNHSIDSIDQGHMVAENHDNIVFAGSNNRSPWKVAPLNVSEEQFKQVNIELSQYKNEVQRLKEQSQAAELVFKQAEEDLKLKLHDTEEDFKIKVEKTEENYKVQLGKAEEEFKLNLEKVTEDFKLKLQQLEADFQLKQKRTEDHFTLQLQKLSCKVDEQENKIKSQSENLDLYSKISAALKTEKSLYKKQLKEAEEKHLFKNFITEENIGHYTGLPNLGTFHWLLSMVPAQLNYYFGSNVKCISREDQLFITLFKLRRNVSHQLLADRFKVSLFTISNIVITWVSALEIILVEGIMNKNVPSLQKVRRSMPEVFNMYPNCRMIFDCTEVEVEVPSLMSNQNEVYSSYKSRTTFKALIVIAPNGTIIYVSDLFPGSTSDKVLVYNCGVLDLLKSGDAVMADKGFPIQDLLPPGVSLNLPPFKETPQFTRGQVFETLQIARSRIHVERAILRVKYFHILDKIPHSLFQFATNIFKVCAGLTNLRFSLIKEVEDDMKS